MEHVRTQVENSSLVYLSILTVDIWNLGVPLHKLRDPVKEALFLTNLLVLLFGQITQTDQEMHED